MLPCRHHQVCCKQTFPIEANTTSESSLTSQLTVVVYISAKTPKKTSRGGTLKTAAVGLLTG